MNDIDFDGYPDNDTFKMHMTTLMQNKNHSNSYKSYQIIDWSSFLMVFLRDSDSDISARSKPFLDENQGD